MKPSKSEDGGEPKKPTGSKLSKLEAAWENKVMKRSNFLPSRDVMVHPHYYVPQSDLGRFNCWCLPPSLGEFLHFRRSVHIEVIASNSP